MKLLVCVDYYYYYYFLDNVDFDSCFFVIIFLILVPLILATFTDLQHLSFLTESPDKKQRIKKIVDDLPLCHRFILSVLIGFLVEVCEVFFLFCKRGSRDCGYWNHVERNLSIYIYILINCEILVSKKIPTQLFHLIIVK